MSTTTSGHVSVTPVMIETDVALADLVAAMSEDLYRPQQVPSSGWGSVEDPDEFVGKRLRYRPRPGRPTLVPGDERYPQRLRARYYWDRPDASLMRTLGAEADPLLTHTFQATDIHIAESDRPGIYFGLIGVRSKRELHMYPAQGLRRLVESADQGASVSIDSTPYRIEHDLFFWLIYRYSRDTQLATDLSLDIVRAVSAQDRLFRTASLSEGADLDRLELAAMVAAQRTFGPVKLALFDNALGLSVEFELHVDGGFSVYVGRSEYDDWDIPKHVKYLRLVDDVAFVVLPKLQASFSSDSAWRRGGRSDFVADAKAVLSNAAARR